MNITNIKKNNFFKNKLFNKIHFIGIGGSGMNGIALILLKLGYQISGSDLLKTTITQKLIKLGAIIYFQHSKKNIKNIDLIIISSAIPLTNPEIIEGKKKKNIPILSRGEMLQILMQYKFGIAISGTHGKTTTTAMIFDIFNQNKLDPTIINGGLIKSISSYSQIGYSNYLIAETDESDGSFLYLTPKIIVVTNIEPDHMNYYNNNFNLLKQSFLKFINIIPPDGIVILCIDNHAIKDIIPKIKCKIITYGFNKTAEFHISHYKQNNFISNFTLIRKNQSKLEVLLKIPGKHNALNAAAAIAVATNQNISDFKILKSLENFQGTGRRFEYLGKISIQSNNVLKKNIMLIDDYGHHPTELSENIKTIRTSWPEKNLIMIFQPHRYTRIHNLYNEFIKVLSQVDTLFMLDVYPANESIIEGADSKSLYNDIKKIKNINVLLIQNHQLILNTIIPYLNENDIILIQGAGNIKKIANKFFIKKIEK